MINKKKAKKWILLMLKRAPFLAEETMGVIIYLLQAEPTKKVADEGDRLVAPSLPQVSKLLMIPSHQTAVMATFGKDMWLGCISI